MVRVEMPEQRARDPDQRSVGELDLALLNRLNCPVIDNDFVVPSLYEPARDVLDLLAGLNEEVIPGRDLDGDAASRVASPDVQTGVARTAVDGEEVEVGVEAGENGVLGAVLDEVGGGWGEEVRAVGAGGGEGVLGQTEADGGHLGEFGDSGEGGMWSVRIPQRQRKQFKCKVGELTHPSWTCPIGPW